MQKIVVFIGSVLVGTFAVVIASGMPSVGPIRSGSTSISVARGSQLFKSQCSGCHTIDEGANVGSCPSLANIGVVAATRQKGQSAEEYIIKAIVDPAAYRHPGVTGVMPDVAAELSDEQIQSLTAFLISQGSTLDLSAIQAQLIKRPKDLKMSLEHDRERLMASEALFSGKGQCSQCHHRNSRLAPSLHGVSTKGREYILESIVNPNALISAKYQSSMIVTNRGESIIGRILSQSETELEVAITDPKVGVVITYLDRDDIAEDDEGKQLIKQIPQSPMPGNYQSLLTESEIEELVYLLERMKYSLY